MNEQPVGLFDALNGVDHATRAAQLLVFGDIPAHLRRNCEHDALDIARAFLFLPETLRHHVFDLLVNGDAEARQERMIALHVAEWLDTERDPAFRRDFPGYNPVDEVIRIYGATRKEARRIVKAARALRSLPPFLGGKRKKGGKR